MPPMSPDRSKWTRFTNWLGTIWSKFTKWLGKSTIVPQNLLLSFSLGFIAAYLPLAVNLLSKERAAIMFWAAFGLLIVVLFVVKPKPFSQVAFRTSRWGVFSMIVLGFGIGALCSHYSRNFIWLWGQFRRINYAQEWILVSLFLLGVVLGFFVVRNWSKDQKDFIASITAVLGAAFLSTMLGNLDQALSSVSTFAYYSLGFVLSGTINLIAFAFLVAHYTRTQSPSSRSVIDFLYGSDIAKRMDAYFLKNFEEDPNYAKRKLKNALEAYRDILRVEFAKKMTRRKLAWEGAQSSPPVPPPDFSRCLSMPPLDYFELLSIESKEPVTSPPQFDPEDIFDVVFRRIPKNAHILPEMIRVAISVKWQDNIEYVVPPGQYKRSFPYFGSVAGLALAVNHTIVMDRDRYKKFRGKDLGEGRTPNEVDQKRGLDKVDYLSYVAVPMASSFGQQEEFGLGILHVDTKLFACSAGHFDAICYKERGTDGQEIYKLQCTRDGLDQFAEFASNIYKEHDEYIENLEQFRYVIIPLLELYLKCRIGTP